MVGGAVTVTLSESDEPTGSSGSHGELEGDTGGPEGEKGKNIRFFFCDRDFASSSHPTGSLCESHHSIIGHFLFLDVWFSPTSGPTGSDVPPNPVRIQSERQDSVRVEKQGHTGHKRM